MIDDQMTLEDLANNFKELNLIGKAIVTTMMAWDHLSSKKHHLSHETKSTIMLNHLKMLELATEWETLSAYTSEYSDEFYACVNLRLDKILNELKFIQNNIDILESGHGNTH